jgi:heat shock protein HslJ
MLTIRGSNFVCTGLILIIGVLLASCGDGSTAVSAAADPDLTESEWVLASINDKPIAAGTTAPLVFGEAENFLGATGCNLFAGTYSIGESNVLNFQPNVSTTWDCEEPKLVQEQSMLLVLSSTSNYKIEGDKLTITNPNGDRRGTFNRMDPLVLAGTTWNLDAYNDGQGALVKLIAGTQITASFGEGGTLSGSAGCNRYNTTYDADLNNISIDPIFWTAMGCPEPEGVMSQESSYLSTLRLASTYNNLGIGLNLFDSEGQILATYIRADFFNEQ